MTKLGAPLLIGLACAGCATTSGNAWLSSPLEQQAELSHEVSIAAEPSAEARPRLSHTVTLGETYVSPPSPAAPSGVPAVQVNVQTQVPIVVNNYGGYGYGYAYGGYGYGANATTRSTSARTSSGAPTKVGGDFPAPPDYGPRALR
jgi:hypothetical protein